MTATWDNNNNDLEGQSSSNEEESSLRTVAFVAFINDESSSEVNFKKPLTSYLNRVLH